MVLVVKGDDTDCNGTLGSHPLRTKNITLVINPTVTKHAYIIASASALAIALLFCISYITGVIVFNVRERKLERQEPINEQEPGQLDEGVRSSSVEVTLIDANISFA